MLVGKISSLKEKTTFIKPVGKQLVDQSDSRGSEQNMEDEHCYDKAGRWFKKVKYNCNDFRFGSVSTDSSTVRVTRRLGPAHVNNISTERSISILSSFALNESLF